MCVCMCVCMTGGMCTSVGVGVEGGGHDKRVCWLHVHESMCVCVHTGASPSLVYYCVEFSCTLKESFLFRLHIDSQLIAQHFQQNPYFKLLFLSL